MCMNKLKYNSKFMNEPGWTVEDTYIKNVVWCMNTLPTYAYVYFSHSLTSSIICTPKFESIPDTTSIHLSSRDFIQSIDIRTRLNCQFRLIVECDVIVTSTEVNNVMAVVSNVFIICEIHIDLIDNAQDR